MASWDRYGEAKKYSEVADTNKNPKHVGESLRQLTLEDRLELRRQQRELQKKRKLSSAKATVELLPGDDDESSIKDKGSIGLDEVNADAQRPGKFARPNIRPKAHDNGHVVLEEETTTTKKPCVGLVVVLEEEDATPSHAPSVVNGQQPSVIDLDVEFAPALSEGARKRAQRKARAAQGVQVCVLD